MSKGLKAIKPDWPFKTTKSGILLSVRVKPGASKMQIEGVDGETVKVRLTARPEGGKANEQLIELLSEELHVRKTAIRIIKGHTSRNKIVEVTK